MAYDLKKDLERGSVTPLIAIITIIRLNNRAGELDKVVVLGNEPSEIKAGVRRLISGSLLAGGDTITIEEIEVGA